MLKRAIGRATNCVLGLILLAPVLALLPAAVLDIGPAPESRTRFSMFPLALAALDPLIWTSLWNSVAVALIVAVGSLAIGVTLGGVVSRYRFWGRPVLSVLIIAPAVVAPAFSSLGLLVLCDPSGPRVLHGLLDSIARSEGYPARLWPWLVWVWTAWIQGTALVAVTTRSAYSRVQPSRQDAARLAGARPSRVWWTLTWPALRPRVSSAVYLVFMLNLADPGAPLVLGLRRTLGFQMVAIALGPDPFPRLAAIALMVLAITLAGRTLIWWRGSSVFQADISPGDVRDALEPQMRNAAWLPAAGSCLILGCWSLLAWFPVAGLLRAALGPGPSSGDAHTQSGLGIVHLLLRLTTGPVLELLAHSALLGLGVVVLLCLLNWRSSLLQVGSKARTWRGPATLLAVLVSPLVAGAGVLALGRTALLCSRFFAGSLAWSRAGVWMERVVLAFDPFCLPVLLVFVGSCLAFLPRRLVARSEPPGGAGASARQVDQFRLAGAGRGSAAWHVRSRARAIPLSRMVLWGTLVATAITPALVLAPTLESRPIGPGIVVLSDQPEDSRAQAATLALTAIALDLLALGWASIRVGRVGDIEAAELA